MVKKPTKKQKDVDIHIKVDNIEKAIRSGMMKKNNKCSSIGCGTSTGCGYGLGFIGAIVYYVSTAATFGAGIIGVLKAVVWPAFLVFELMKFLGM